MVYELIQWKKSEKMLIIFIIFPIEACAYVGRYVDVSSLVSGPKLSGFACTGFAVATALLLHWFDPSV